MAKDYEKYIGEFARSYSGKIYKIEKYIAEGGNGYVFDCVDENQKKYVLKLLHTNETSKVEKFEREISFQKQVKSKYVVKCIDYGKQTFGNQKVERHFYIMNKYDKTLEDLINENAITPSRAFKYIIQLCKGLKALHRIKNPIIHRDLKPENILYDSKKDILLICDFGLAHQETKIKSISKGFVGNIDYHAPEQKIRGKGKIGTYTDIYSLGLIINVLFTKEIAQGEQYKKIWECCPAYYFLDSLVERMTVNNPDKRENDIRNILIGLEKHNIEYKEKKFALKKMYLKERISTKKIDELINIYSLIEYSFKKRIDWEIINLNYKSDFNFSCNELLENSLLVKAINYKLERKFNYESNAYDGYSVPYKSLNLDCKEDVDLYITFAKTLDSIGAVYREIEGVKKIMKKKFLSLCDYHARELLEIIDSVKKEVVYNTIDAPAMRICYCINTYFSDFKIFNYNIERTIKFINYTEKDIDEKSILFKDEYENYKKLIKCLKVKIPKLACTYSANELQLFFDSFRDENIFISYIKEIAALYEDNDPNKDDLMDIIDYCDEIGTKRIYCLDDYTISLILGNFN